jgi:hypothetical protein
LAKISLEGIIGAIVAVVSGGLLRRKPFCIWVKRGTTWECLNPAGNSKRRCEQGIRELRALPGCDDYIYAILPKNLRPPG